MEKHPRLSVRAHDDGVDRWEVVEALPAPALRSQVTRYSSYWEQVCSFAARRELASTSGVLIYALGAPLEIIGADGGRVTLAAGEAFAGAIADSTSVSRALGPQDGIHVFMPLASLAAVTGAPLSEIANRVAPLRDLIGRAAADLGGRLCDSADAEARFRHLDSFLCDRFAAASADGDRPVTWAMDRLAAAAGPVTSRLAEEIGWSRRHFVRRFRAATGFSPDRYRRLVRFERFVAAIVGAPGDSLAGLAAECGYVDQAHLTRDVRDFSAMTPGELRARLIPGGGGICDD